VRRAERVGFKAIAFTMDIDILGRGEVDIKNRLATIWKFQLEQPFHKTLHGSSWLN